MAIELNSVLVRSGDLVESRIDDDIVMMSVETGRYYGLAHVGARVWALLAEPMEVSALCERLLLEYRVEPERCRSDVIAFLQRMAEEGLVVAKP